MEQLGVLEESLTLEARLGQWAARAETYTKQAAGESVASLGRGGRCQPVRFSTKPMLPETAASRAGEAVSLGYTEAATEVAIWTAIASRVTKHKDQPSRAAQSGLLLQVMLGKQQDRAERVGQAVARRPWQSF